MDELEDAPQEEVAPDEDFSKLFTDSLSAGEKTYAPGDRVRAEILAVGQEDGIVVLGPGKEGVVASGELSGLKAGDSVDLFVTSVRPAEIRLSTRPTDKNVAEDLKEAFESRRPVEGRVAEVCKGGVRVSIKGKLAFCPISQLDTKRTENPAEFVGRSLAFRITEFAEGGRNVVLSRRKLLEEDVAQALAAYNEKNPDGSIVTGTVTKLQSFGAFIELLPGVEGLAHISELAWSRLKHPSDLLKVGQTLAVKILKRETVDGRLRIILSLKQTTEKPAPQPAAPAAPAAPPIVVVDPWTKYAPGQVLQGKVTRKEPYGLFVQLEPGIIGLLHHSKVVDHAEFQFDRRKVGDAVQVEIGEVKLSERRISLQLPRDPDADEWKKHQPSAAPSLGALLGDDLKSALEKKTP